MVIYFSGTGNSKYVASSIADILSDEIVCSNKYIKSNEKCTFSSNKPWVFVFPVYMANGAKIFFDFLKRTEFLLNKKAYFVATCHADLGISANTAYEFCKEKNLEYYGTAQVLMPQNYILYFRTTPADIIKKRQNEALQETKKICKIITNQKNLPVKLKSKFLAITTKSVEKFYYKHLTKDTKFYIIDDLCNECGLCAHKCPVNNINYKDNKPNWKAKCIHCMSCINSCPKGAIEYGNRTKHKKRYVCAKYKP